MAMKKFFTLILISLSAVLVTAQNFNYYASFSNIDFIKFSSPYAKIQEPYKLLSVSAAVDAAAKTPLLHELGYILAMETTFTGLSYLASRGPAYGPAVTGGFDIFMGLAGLNNSLYKKTKAQKLGFYLLSAGFIAKALYNFRFGRNHSSNVQFWTNFISYNVLVFSGYFLDSLK